LAQARRTNPALPCERPRRASRSDDSVDYGKRRRGGQRVHEPIAVPPAWADARPPRPPGLSRVSEHFEGEHRAPPGVAIFQIPGLEARLFLISRYAARCGGRIPAGAWLRDPCATAGHGLDLAAIVDRPVFTLHASRMGNTMTRNRLFADWVPL